VYNVAAHPVRDINFSNANSKLAGHVGLKGYSAEPVAAAMLYRPHLDAARLTKPVLFYRHPEGQQHQAARVVDLRTVLADLDDVYQVCASILPHCLGLIADWCKGCCYIHILQALVVP